MLAEIKKNCANQRVFRFGLEMVDRLSFDEDTIDALTVNGLPECNDPYLIFGTIDGPRCIADVYHSCEFEHLFLYEIGVDGLGHSICIDVRNNCHIVACPHYNNFRKKYMNVSAEALIYFLNSIHSFNRDIKAMAGASLHVMSEFRKERSRELVISFYERDPHALDEGTYWNKWLREEKGF